MCSGTVYIMSCTSLRQSDDTDGESGKTYFRSSREMDGDLFEIRTSLVLLLSLDAL